MHVLSSFPQYEQQMWWLLEILSGQSGIRFPFHTLSLCLMFRVCPVDRLMRSVSALRLSGRANSQKNLLLFSELSHMRDPQPSAKLLFIVFSLREEKHLEIHLRNSQMGFRELYVPILIGNNSCIFTFNLLPDTKLLIAKWGDSSFFFPIVLWNNGNKPLC